MIDAPQLIEWFDSQVKRIDTLLEEKSYYYHTFPELYKDQLITQRYYYSMTIMALTRLVNNDTHFPKFEAWEIVKDNTIITENRCVVDRIEMYIGGKGYEIFKKALEVEND